MPANKRYFFFVAILLVILLLSPMIPPTVSRYVLEDAGELLHTIVTGPKLTVTFKNGDAVVRTINADYNEVITIDHTKPDNITPPEPDAVWQGWVNALGATAPNTVKVIKNVVFNAKWQLTEYYVRYLDLDGNIVHQEQINKSTMQIDLDAADNAKLASLLASMENSLNTDEMKGYGLTFTVVWEAFSITSPLSGDIYVNPEVSFTADESSDASIALEPVVDTNGNIIDENGDGFPDGFVVTGASFAAGNMDITIPDNVAGTPIVGISDGSFAGFDDLHVVRIPKSVTAIGSYAFSDASLGFLQNGETITLYYEGSKAEWENINKSAGWDDGLGDGTRIFFLNGGETVDSSQGYMQRTKKTGFFSATFSWESKATLSASFNTEYTGTCNCGIDGCDGNTRPDAKYWPAR